MRRTVLVLVGVAVLLVLLGAVVGPLTVRSGSGQNSAFSPQDGNTLLGGAVVILLFASVLIAPAGVRAGDLRVGLGVLVVGIALITLGANIGPPEIDTFFLRAVADSPGAAVTITDNGRPAALSPNDGNTFMGAGAALVLIATVWFADSVRRQSRRA